MSTNPEGGDLAVQIRSEYDGHVVRIVLNRPKANVIDAAMVLAICDALEHGVTPSTRLVVFEGAGEHFSFGASVEEHRPASVRDLLTTFHGLFGKLADVGVPTCAAVRGQCLGGGLELATWCTWVVATPDARLGQPEIKLAMFPPMGSLLLPWRAGGATAMDLCVTGRTVPADDALTLGIVNAVTEDPEAWWRQLFDDQLAKTSAAALRMADRAARSDLLRQIDEHLPRLESLFVDELMKTHDANEGIAAFMERRAPKYQDR